MDMLGIGSQATLEIRERFFSLLESLSALRSLSNIDLLTQNESQLLGQALNELVKHQHLEFCSIFILENNVLSCIVGTSVNEQHAGHAGHPQTPLAPEKSMRFTVGEGVIGMACQSGKLQYCRDCSKDERFKPFAEGARRRATGSLIAVPIQFSNETLGILNISHPIPDYFEPWQQHTLTLFCSILGQMLHNHRMLYKLDKEVSKRTLELQQALEESEDLRARYQRLSMIDSLTGLYNRRYFFAEAEAMLSRALRYQLPFSLLLLDVDHFKQINDKWGHQAGDRILQQISETLCQEARQGDVVARLGGEEFVIALPNTRIAGADLMALRIQEQIATLAPEENEDPFGITVSIGLTELGDRAISDTEVSQVVELLYREADSAMYECKRRGRNRRLSFNPNQSATKK